MITRAEAEGIVLDRLNKNADASHRAAILDAWIKPYGWVVLYDSELFVRTGLPTPSVRLVHKPYPAP